MSSSSGDDDSDSSSSSSSSSEEEEEEEKDRDETDTKKKKRKKRKDSKKKHKKKKHKKKKHKKKHKKKKRRLEKKIKAAEKLVADAETAERLGLLPLTQEDYFSKAREFRAWLALKNEFLDEMEHDAARKAFASFVHKWNTGQLTEAFYQGRVDAYAQQPPTRHRWAFAKNLSEDEAMQLASLRDAAQSGAGESLARRGGGGGGGSGGGGGGERRHGGDDERRDFEARGPPRQGHRLSRDQRRQAIDEMAPRADAGHARRAEERGARRAVQREREEEDSGFAVSDGAMVFGSDGQDELRALKAGRQRREAERAGRAAQLKERERARNDKFKRKLGLQ